MNMTLLRPEDYITTQWSGGTTTQLAIAPCGAVYAERNFLWRLSSATVDLDESDFTALPDYRRWISTLRGDMTLTHNGGEALTLHPYDVHEFDGGDDTHSWGKCKDFNLMLRKGKADGSIRTIRVGGGAFSFRTPAQAHSMMLLYCAEGNAAVRCGGKMLGVAAGESVLIEDSAGATATIESAAPAVFMAAQAWEN
ncbi:MAG: HutD family protein [Eubacteriales bacterium]|nr:HutD family protein [Eubacteriales bacterium]